MSRLAVLPALCALLLAACGEQPDEPPAVFDVQAPRGTAPADFPDAGLSLMHPANWELRRRDAPGVFELLSGQAVVAAWAYPREEPLPETEAQLEGAKARLVDAIEERDPDYRIRMSVVREVAGAPAIDISGSQVLARRKVRTRSVHVFKGDVEYVIEAIVPPADYRLVDRRVMTPLLDSLELEGEVSEAAG